MRKMKMLLAALAISGLAFMPLGNSAQAQVAVYNHGQRVRVANTASKDWSNIKSGVRTGYNNASNATTKQWSNLKSGVRTDSYKLTHGGRSAPVIQQQPMSYSGNYRVGMTNERQARIERARLMRERMHRQALYHARLERER